MAGKCAAAKFQIWGGRLPPLNRRDWSIFPVKGDIQWLLKIALNFYPLYQHPSLLLPNSTSYIGNPLSPPDTCSLDRCLGKSLACKYPKCDCQNSLPPQPLSPLPPRFDFSIFYSSLKEGIFPPTLERYSKFKILHTR